MKKFSLWTVMATIFLLLVFASSACASTEESKDIQKMLISPSSRDLGITVYDNPDSTSEAIRKEIDSKLAKGETKEQIINEYLAKYGSDLLADPQKKGFALGVWIIPPVIILLSGGMIYFYIKKGKDKTSQAPVKRVIDSEVESQLNKEIIKYL